MASQLIPIFKLLLKDIKDMDEFYNNAIGLTQYEAVQKNIEFDGFFREKFEIAAEHPLSFDEEYFENEERSELYVFLSAIVDPEIFEAVNFIWLTVRGQIVSEDILQQEIEKLKKEGVKF
jgi:hypothetical protein